MPSALVVFSVRLVLNVPIGGATSVGVTIAGVVVVVVCDVVVCAIAKPEVIANAITPAAKSVFMVEHPILLG